jgi:hypothetical protein
MRPIPFREESAYPWASFSKAEDERQVPCRSRGHRHCLDQGWKGNWIIYFFFQGIGFAIAKRLGLDGASVVVSSRKQDNVQSAVNALRMEGISCEGCVAHVGEDKDRTRLIDFTIER